MTDNTSSERKRSASGYRLDPLSPTTRAQRESTLSAEERRVLLAAGTEAPFCGGLLKEHAPGLYTCRLCALPLFRSAEKFHSGTGWPSFFAPFDQEHIARIHDTSHGMARTEIRCARCHSHLGHVFPDGPPPTGERFCLNSAALCFFKEGDIPVQPL